MKVKICLMAAVVLGTGCSPSHGSYSESSPTVESSTKQATSAINDDMNKLRTAFEHDDAVKLQVVAVGSTGHACALHVRAFATNQADYICRAAGSIYYQLSTASLTADLPALQVKLNSLDWSAQTVTGGQPAASDDLASTVKNNWLRFSSTDSSYSPDRLPVIHETNVKQKDAQLAVDFNLSLFDTPSAPNGAEEYVENPDAKDASLTKPDGTSGSLVQVLSASDPDRYLIRVHISEQYFDKPATATSNN